MQGSEIVAIRFNRCEDHCNRWQHDSEITAIYCNGSRDHCNQLQHGVRRALLAHACHRLSGLQTPYPNLTYKVLRKGAVFGEDMILESPLLRRTPSTNSLAYTEVQFIVMPVVGNLRSGEGRRPHQLTLGSNPGWG